MVEGLGSSDKETNTLISMEAYQDLQSNAGIRGLNGVGVGGKRLLG